jgi:hypothetical protein
MPPDEDQLSLRQADQIRGDLYAIQDDLDFIKVQLAHLPTRNEVWRAAMLGMLGMLGGAVAAVTLIERRSCPRPEYSSAERRRARGSAARSPDRTVGRILEPLRHVRRVAHLWRIGYTVNDNVRVWADEA